MNFGLVGNVQRRDYEKTKSQQVCSGTQDVGRGVIGHEIF